jgi:hypothetical protein
MKYLSFTIEAVRGEIQTRKDKLARAETIRKHLEDKQEREEIQKRKEAEEFKKALEIFESSLSVDEQHDFLNTYYQNNYGPTSFIPKNVVKRMAVQDWYKKIGNETKA